MTLRYDQVADLIKIVDASACEELVLETSELKLVVRRHGARSAGEHAAVPTASAPQVAAAPTPKAAQPSQRPASPAAQGVEVRAPMVGTFYRAPAPDAPPFVEVGSVVAQGAALAVIEVMKLFTTVYAETGGRIAEICAANAELVDYGRVLFVIEDPAK